VCKAKDLLRFTCPLSYFVYGKVLMNEIAARIRINESENVAATTVNDTPTIPSLKKLYCLHSCEGGAACVSSTARQCVLDSKCVCVDGVPRCAISPESIAGWMCE